MPNPYSAPETASHGNVVRRRRHLGPAIGLCIGSLLLAALVASAIYVTYLFVRYPLLTDPSSPDDSWPENAVFTYTIVAGLSTIIGIPTFGVSLQLFRRARAETSA